MVLPQKNQQKRYTVMGKSGVNPELTWADYWKRQNKDNKVKLYCQSCCYRYPDECIFIEEVHPYDSFAEECPDYVPKDMYKGKSRAKCWKKRLEFEPDYRPLPDALLWHPIYFPALCNSTEYFMILTKEKTLRHMEVKN